MAWIILSANGDELERRELVGAVVIGRSPECDIAVRDILLSRTHCRLEPVGGGWKVVDLNSKNGTRVGWEGVQSHLLRDGDHLRMGRTRIVYHTGPFEPAPYRAPRIDRLVRPADPHEALTGTVTDFVLVEEDPEDEDVFVTDRPFPQPRPLDPASYSEPEVETLLEELASSFGGEGGGGTALARPRTVARALPRVMKPIYREIRRPSETDLSLQVDARNLPAAVVPVVVRRRSRLLAVAGWTLAGAFGTAVMVMSAWLLTMAP